MVAYLPKACFIKCSISILCRSYEAVAGDAALGLPAYKGSDLSPKFQSILVQAVGFGRLAFTTLTSNLSASSLNMEVDERPSTHILRLYIIEVVSKVRAMQR